MPYVKTSYFGMQRFCIRIDPLDVRAVNASSFHVKQSVYSSKIYIFPQFVLFVDALKVIYRRFASSPLPPSISRKVFI